MNLLPFFGAKSEYKLSLDGSNDYLSFSSPGQNIHKAVMKFESNGFSSGSSRQGFFNVAGQAAPYILTGNITGSVSGEVLTMYESVPARTYTTDNIPSGLITLEVEWTGSEYQFIIDGTPLSMSTENEPVSLQSSWNEFGRRNGGNYLNADVRYLALYGSGGIIHEWLLNEGSGTTAEDNIGNNDITIHGASWIKI